MKRLKIMKAYAVLWLFIYFLVYTNIEAMTTFFLATLTFNLAVLTVMVIGIIVIMRASINLVMLAGTFGILAYKKDDLGFYLQGIEKIMPANIAHMFHARAEKGVLLFTAEESRSVIEWIDEKFSHQNRYINYFIGTSLMIGLLGTFTGLLVSIDEMGRIILSLTGDINLGEIVAGFSGPLSGMAVGFGSSLFGVVSAIVLGLMGYILNKNQEALVEGVEDWLKGRIIESTGVGAPVQAFNANQDALPEQRNSFLDVFIDNISMLTKEMAKISQTNERLHSITIASVQQARDEHEINYELFEAMSKSLLSIDATAKAHAIELKERLESIEGVVTNSQTTTLEELKEITKQLALVDSSQNEKVETLVDSLSTITQKLESEQRLLESMEKLNKLQISDARKQSSALQSKVDTQETQTLQIAQKLEVLERILEQNAQNHQQDMAKQEESKELLAKHRELLELLVGKNDANLSELKRISSIQSAPDGTIVATHEDVVQEKESRGFFKKLFK